MRGRLAIVVLAMIVALAFGCARILGFGDVPSPADAGEDASEEPAADDSSAAADASDANPCALYRAPSPPSSDDPSDAGDRTFVAAVHTVDLGLRPDGGPVPLLGYDIDGVDTCCQGGPESCRAALAGSTHCDEDAGRDDQAGQLLLTAMQVASGDLNQDVFNQRIASGKESVLVEVEHYNGRPNDTQVTVAFYASDGIAPGPDGGAVVPQWDGTDVWTVDSQFVIGTSADGGVIVPNRFDTHAYVSNGVLVANVGVPIPLKLGAFSIQLTGTTMVGRVVPDNGSFRVADGQITGRWSASSVFAWVQTVRNPFGAGYVCPGTSAYAGLKQSVCAALDVVSDPTQDRTGATCDALSMALGFTADPALTGPVTSRGTMPPTCPDGGPDDCTR